MTAETLLSHVTQFGYVAIFIAVLVRTVRSPRRSHLNAAFFFGAATLLIWIGWATEALDADPGEFVQDVSSALLLTLPYTLLRLADDFTGVRTEIRRAAEVGLAGSVVVTFVFADPAPGVATLGMLIYFLGATIYASLRFLGVARTTRGVAAIRMRAVASGSAMLALLVITAILGDIFDAAEGFWQGASSLAGLASGLFYFAGFAPPDFLKRAWQAPELGRFLDKIATTSPALEHTGGAFGEIEAAAAQTMGAPRVLISLWNPEQDRLVAPSIGAAARDSLGEDTTLAAVAYRTGRAIFSEDAARDDPGNADLYQEFGSRAVLVAPLEIAGERFGVVAAFGDRPPVFAEDDLQLLTTIAHQIAVLVRDRALLQEASRVRAQEETMRLKDDFLSAAAHDLKTPLTTILGESQLMLRRAARLEGASEEEALGRVVAEARRMRRLVEDLLDASLAEQTGFIRELLEVDLLNLCRDVASEYAPSHDVQATGDPLVCPVDPERIRQVLVNLVENAIKYSPGGGAIRISLGSDDGAAILSVSDSGVGIPHEDLPMIFERFQRGSRTDDRRFTGLGVGLYLCRRVVEDHGGEISVSSQQGRGSTFEVRLPRTRIGGETTDVSAHPGH